MAVLFCLVASGAYGATTTAGAAMPWDTPLQNLRDNLTGPTAYGLALIGFVLVMGILIFGGELNHWGRSLCFLILTACCLVGVNGLVTGFGIAGATVESPVGYDAWQFFLGVVTASLIWGLWMVAFWLRRRYRAARHATAALGDGGLPNQL
jgi:type IV secretion system protein VirB2